MRMCDNQVAIHIAENVYFTSTQNILLAKKFYHYTTIVLAL